MPPQFSVPQTIRDILGELQRLRSQPVGDPPTRAGAARLQDILGGRDRPDSFRPGIIAEWTRRAIGKMTVKSGDNQLGVAGDKIPGALSVLVTSIDKTPLVGVVVRFVVSGGDGELTTHSAHTLDDKKDPGVATLPAGAWVLGPRGENRLTAFAGNTSVTFTARAVTRFAAVTATDQSATAGTPVPEAPTVLVTDHENRPLQDVEVTFTVASGGGSVDQPKARSGSDGRATSGRWTVGKPGLNSVVASVGSRRVEFTATAK